MSFCRFKNRYEIRTMIESEPKTDGTTSATFHNESFSTMSLLMDSY